VRRTGWHLPAIAAAGALVVAVGFALAVDAAQRVVTPAPQLHSVPDGFLVSRGLKLGPAPVAPYCGLEQAVIERGWMGTGALGCPISRAAAESAASRTPPGRPLESALVTISSGPPELRGRLVWVVVVRPTSQRQNDTLGVVDARSGRLLAQFPLGGASPSAGG
jgi:hypothetical protein